MKDFAALFTAIDQTTKTTVKTRALADYFTHAPNSDKLWCIALFSGRRPKRAVTTTQLRQWAAERAGLPLWLWRKAIRSWAISPRPSRSPCRNPRQPRIGRSPTGSTRCARCTPWIEDARKPTFWPPGTVLDATERFLFNKLLTGGFRIGVSQKLMTRALAQATGQEEADAGAQADGRLDAGNARAITR